MRIFDTHCDTPFDMFRNKLTLENEQTAVSLLTVKDYEKKFFVTAFWSDCKKTEQECWEEFLESSEYFDGIIEGCGDRAMICKNADSLTECSEHGKLGAVKAVEGARLLCGDLDRVGILYDNGVRQLLPLWGGSDFIGGAWDTDDGLTEFGKTLIRECENVGIVVDTSHMSRKSFWDTAEYAKCPIIASHSNYMAVSRHDRNLDDAQLCEIIRRGGIIGISLCAAHVNAEKYANRTVTWQDDFVGDVVRNIMYCLENGGEKNLCLGCDWDGTKMTPQIPNVAYAVKIYDRMIAAGVPVSVADDVFFNNAYNFYKNNIK